MAEFTSYIPGTPSWVDLSSPDPAGSQAFYSELFGWSANDMGPEAGGYAIFTKDGKSVAGVGPQMMPDQPAAWTSYVSVDDVDATVAKATAAGGTAFMEPMDVLEAGRMAVLADPTGAVFALWQPRQHIGAELANEPGSWCWNELLARDESASAAFYAAVFGWSSSPVEDSPTPYTMWMDGERPLGGMMAMPDMVPAAVPPFWMVYFAVSDTDATAEKTVALGGSVSQPPFDTPQGRVAILADPSGAGFAVIQM